jgi:hypothetical protein
MIHVYAFTVATAAVPDVTGIDGAVPRAVGIGDVAAVVGDVDAGSDSHERVLAHGMVVEALARACDAVLPVRFGERFPSDAALVEAVRDRAAALRRRLDLVRGHVELGVTARVAMPAQAVTATSGAEYMRRHAEAAAAETSMLAPLERELRALSSDAAARQAHPGDGVHRHAFLVPRERLAEFRACVDRFAAAHPDVDVLCTGPWPPYSFAGAA